MQMLFLNKSDLYPVWRFHNGDRVTKSTLANFVWLRCAAASEPEEFLREIFAVVDKARNASFEKGSAWPSNPFKDHMNAVAAVLSKSGRRFLLKYLIDQETDKSCRTLKVYLLSPLLAPLMMKDDQLLDLVVTSRELPVYFPKVAIRLYQENKVPKSKKARFVANLNAYAQCIDCRMCKVLGTQPQPGFELYSFWVWERNDCRIRVVTMLFKYIFAKIQRNGYGETQRSKKQKVAPRDLSDFPALFKTEIIARVKAFAFCRVDKPPCYYSFLSPRP